MDQNSISDPILDVCDVADMLAIGETAARGLLSSGAIRCSYLGGRVGFRTTQRAVLDFAESGHGMDKVPQMQERRRTALVARRARGKKPRAVAVTP